MLAIAVFVAPLLFAATATALALLGQRRHSRTLAASAVLVSVPFLLAGAAFVTIFVGAYEVPGAVLLLLGASLPGPWADRTGGVVREQPPFATGIPTSRDP